MKRNNIFWGFVLIMAAGLMLLNIFGVDPGIGVFRLLIGILLAAVMIKSIISVSIEGICFSAAFLIIVFSEEIGMPPVSPFRILLAALLLSLGLNLIFGNQLRKIRKNRRESYRGIEGYEQVVDNETCDHIEVRLKFGSIVKYVESDNFVSGHLSASFGALTVYFDNAVIQNASAEVYVDVSFGAIKLFIPKAWKVENTITSNFAGVNEHGSTQWTEEGKVLYLRGNVNFGAVEIYYI